jgi:hypothetical protein
VKMLCACNNKRGARGLQWQLDELWLWIVRSGPVRCTMSVVLAPRHIVSRITQTG